MRASLLILALLASATATARPKPKPAVPATPAPQATPAAPAFTDPSPQLLVKAQELYASLEYDKVIPLTEVLLQRDDLPLEGKLEAHRLNGSSKAIVQDPIDAEKPFRLLLRLRPNYDLPKDTAPKILAVFRKVQTEERALAQQAELFDREKKIEALKFLDEPPAQAKGGRPVPFSLRLRDPGSVVDSVTVPYRRSGESAYSSLALQRDEDGKWHGQIPAEYTADPKGFTLEYYLATSDAKGALLERGSAVTPLRLEVSAGALVSGKPPPIHRGLFWTGVGATLAAAAVSGGLALSTYFLQRQYTGTTGTVMGGPFVALGNRGESTALGTNIGLIATGVLALVTLLMIPIGVDWDGPASR